MLAAIDAEGAALAAALSGRSVEDMQRPTRCPPWTARELLAHLIGALDRLPDMLAAPEPGRAAIGSLGYYRDDERFSTGATAARVAAATDHAGGRGDGVLLDEVRASCLTLVTCARAEPEGRRVTTRWGDTMSLTSFLVTRLVELAVHGLDLARALDAVPWLTDPAGTIVAGLLFERPDEMAGAVGWDTVDVIEVATGRRSVGADQAPVLARAGLRSPTLG